MRSDPERIKTILRALENRGSHRDNTGAGCRIDWRDHDCCYTCNLVGAILLAAQQELGDEED